jgi:hypothetical protein
MIQIKINQDDIAKVKSMMAGIVGGADKVMVRALNLTLTGVKTDASTEVRNVITASKKAVDATFKTSKATAASLSAKFESTGSPLPLIEYSANQTQKGVSVRVRKDRERKVLAGAFIRTMKSGHKGVFWREYHAAKGPVKKIPYGKLPKKYRLPIKQLFGPSVPAILGNDPVMDPVLAKAGDRLHKNMEHELNFELSKL